MQKVQVHVRVLVALVACAAASCVAVGEDEELDLVEQGVLAPPATVNVVATAQDRATVSWSAVPGAVKYYVSQSTDPNGPFVPVNSARAPSTTLNVAHLTPNTNFCFVVRSEDGTGPGPFSDPACTLTQSPPPPPSTVVVTQTSPTRVTVDWTEVSDATKYYVFQADSLDGTYSYINTTLAPGTSLDVANLVEGETVCFKVQTQVASGVSALSAGVCNTSLQPPTSVTAVQTAATRLSVSWTPATGVDRTYIFESKDGGPNVLVGSVLATSPQSLNRANLSVGAQYCYQLQSQFLPNNPANRSGLTLPVCVQL